MNMLKLRPNPHLDSNSQAAKTYKLMLILKLRFKTEPFCNIDVDVEREFPVRGIVPPTNRLRNVVHSQTASSCQPCDVMDVARFTSHVYDVVRRRPVLRFTPPQFGIL